VDAANAGTIDRPSAFRGSGSWRRWASLQDAIHLTNDPRLTRPRSTLKHDHPGQGDITLN
jgi:hypothetical protein